MSISIQTKRNIGNYISLIDRVILGTVFIFAGSAKITHIDSLIWETEQYRILPESLVPLFSQLLPYLELVIGSLLILGIFTRISSLGSTLLLLAFTIAKISALARGLEIETCPCFGPSVVLHSTQSLVLGIFLLALSIHLLGWGRKYLSLERVFRPIIRERRIE